VSDPELAEHFRQSARPRAEELRALLDARNINVEEIRRHVHYFAGMGATYGFPRISEVADAVEEALIALVRRGEAPSERLLAKWRKAAEAIASELR
jgi:HPt (histidine-containing phosphotransfer) domain-containing protein